MLSILIATSSRRVSLHPPIRVFLVDDHPIVRAGARLAIAGLEGFVVCGESGSAAGAPEAASAARAHLVMLDLLLGSRGDGLELVAAMRRQLPEARILVFSMNAEDVFAERALHAGADGYLVKGGDLVELQFALREIAAGRTYLSAHLRARLTRPGEGAPPGTDRVGSLSDRELQIFLLLGAGKSTQQIADELGISMKTVSAHRENVKIKLGITQAAELVRHAVTYVLGQGTLSR